MVVPDFELICEIMLVAEGFLEARLLARKFITLYTLCKELLSKQVGAGVVSWACRGRGAWGTTSGPPAHPRAPAACPCCSLGPQDHYDWGLRAIKSVLVVAGSLKRGDPSRAEDQVLMRALRDFNIPKIVTDDLPVFMGLIGDLFPALDVPRKRDLNFEKVGPADPGPFLLPRVGWAPMWQVPRWGRWPGHPVCDAHTPVAPCSPQLPLRPWPVLSQCQGSREELRDGGQACGALRSLVGGACTSTHPGGSRLPGDTSSWAGVFPAQNTARGPSPTSRSSSRASWSSSCRRRTASC